MREIGLKHGLYLLQVRYIGEPIYDVPSNTRPYYVYDIRDGEYEMRDDTGEIKWYNADLFVITDDYRQKQ